eukprot:TRINITY_DN9275_c0_g1_i1.p1 TRINITY_DN9275_c0_g1~~TRINITY_DN9275_c0_g1_i1.p1  ORF type:complete len:152 (-),score=7.76 TRINITY_DN9275_c0_g1_i1:92-502(-)
MSSIRTMILAVLAFACTRLGLSLLILAILSTTIEHADASGKACSVSAQDCDKVGSMVYYCNHDSGDSGTCRLCWEKICTSSGGYNPEKKKCGCQESSSAGSSGGVTHETKKVEESASRAVLLSVPVLFAGACAFMN